MKPMLRHCLWAAAVLTLATTAPSQPAAASRPPGAATLRVAAVQMRSEPDLRANVAKIRQLLADCAARGAQVAAFPECAVSSYDRDAIHANSAQALAEAEAAIATACRNLRIAAIVGLPRLRDGRIFNEALVLNARGETVTRYAKVYLTGAEAKWPFAPGTELPAVFPLGPTFASVMICHDSRFPELCTLPVLAGARVVFYISHEAALIKETKIGPYRAQVQARAVENRIFVVHANAPANDLRTGSHGQSRIVNPEGIILQEASLLQEEIIVADLDLAAANGERAKETLEGPFGDWWREGIKRVPVVK